MYIKGEVEIINDKKWGKTIILPHSCGEWNIGGKKEAEQLIEDLEELIKQLGE